MKVFLVQNRSLSPDSTGYIHLVPKGEFPTVTTIKGKETDVNMLVDDQALDAIMATFNTDSSTLNWTGYLVDKEHFSHDLSQSSEAHAWIKTLQRRADGIWGLPEWTSIGSALIEGKIYKHLSPVLLLHPLSANRGRAFAFTDAGLTNKPRLKTLVPIQCRDGITQEEARMDKIRALFKQPADATEDQLVTLIQQALNRSDEASALEARAESAEKERDDLKLVTLNRDADAFVEKHKDRITDPAKLKTLYVQNRQAAEEFIVLMKPAQTQASTQRVLSRADGQPPAQTVGDKQARDARASEQLDFVESVKNSKRLPTMAQAWIVAQRIKPDLFA